MEENNYYIGDNLDNLKKIKDNSIDFIYFDPPYNTGRNFYNFNDWNGCCACRMDY